ncbi:hypothetical protein FAIPA1_60003 [Frankia sp. AiPs1]
MPNPGVRRAVPRPDEAWVRRAACPGNGGLTCRDGVGESHIGEGGEQLGAHRLAAGRVQLWTGQVPGGVDQSEDPGLLRPGRRDAAVQHGSEVIGGCPADRTVAEEAAARELAAGKSSAGKSLDDEPAAGERAGGAGVEGAAGREAGGAGTAWVPAAAAGVTVRGRHLPVGFPVAPTYCPHVLSPGPIRTPVLLGSRRLAACARRPEPAVPSPLGPADVGSAASPQPDTPAWLLVTPRPHSVDPYCTPSFDLGACPG